MCAFSESDKVEDIGWKAKLKIPPKDTRIKTTVSFLCAFPIFGSKNLYCCDFERFRPVHVLHYCYKFSSRLTRVLYTRLSFDFASKPGIFSQFSCENLCIALRLTNCRLKMSTHVMDCTRNFVFGVHLSRFLICLCNRSLLFS